MITPPAEDFFEITLSQQGVSYILRTYKIVGWVLGVSMIVSIGYLFLELSHYIEYMKLGTKGNKVLFFQLRVMPVILILNILLNVAQIIYFFRFFRSSKKSIDTRQVDLFNHSFKWLLKSTVVACLVIFLNLIFITFYSYIEVGRLLNASAST